MISRLSQLMENPHAASALGSSRKDCIAEILLVDHLRAGESEQDASRTNLFESLCIQFGIASQGIAQGIPVLGKSRRVKNNQIVLVTHPVKELKRIFRKSLVTCITGEVEFHILIGQINRFGRAEIR